MAYGWDPKWGWSVLSTAFFKIYYSYVGLDNVNDVLNEVENPVWTLKAAALLTACIMYALANLAYPAVVPVEDFKRSGESVAALFFQRLFGFWFPTTSYYHSTLEFLRPETR
jgi:amino acid transporter